MNKLPKKFRVNKDLKNSLSEMTTAINQINNMDTRVNTIEDSMGETVSKVNTLESTMDNVVGDETKGIVKQVNDLENSLKQTNRKFKHRFGSTLYLGEAQDLNGKHFSYSLENCKKKANPLLPYLDDFPLTFHISFNQTTNEFYIVEDPDTMHEFAKWLIQEKGKNVPAIKMYQQRYNISHINTYGVEAFHNTWKEFMVSLGNKFSDLGVEYFSIHNEVNSIVGSTTHEPYVLEEIQLAKDLGYKVAIDYAGWPDYNKTLKSVRDVLDAHFLNMYPNVGNLGKEFIFDESLKQFKDDLGFLALSKMRQDYPNADIIVNECGIQDNWDSLAAPAKWDWKNPINSNGVVPGYYLKMLFESFNNVDVKAVWWWYDNVLVKDLSIKTMKEYLGVD